MKSKIQMLMNKGNKTEANFEYTDS